MWSVPGLHIWGPHIWGCLFWLLLIFFISYLVNFRIFQNFWLHFSGIFGHRGPFSTSKINYSWPKYVDWSHQIIQTSQFWPFRGRFSCSVKYLFWGVRQIFCLPRNKKTHNHHFAFFLNKTAWLWLFLFRYVYTQRDKRETSIWYIMYDVIYYISYIIWYVIYNIIQYNIV